MSFGAGGISSIQTPPGNPNFVRLDSKYSCLVCKNVLREAMQTSCGHRICESCIELMFEGKTEPVSCLAGEEDCLDQYRSNITPNPSGRREIRNLPVYCDFHESGCEEELKWKDLADHVSICLYQPVPCPNNGCDKRIAANRKDIHAKEECEYRPEQCQYCNTYVAWKLMQDHIQDVCTAVQITCPYQCGSPAMGQNELNSHTATCLKKPRQCKFRSVGCSFEGTEEEVASHMINDLNQHVEKVTVYTARMEVQSLEIRRELQDVKSERDHMRQHVNKMSDELSTLKTNLNKAMASNKDLKLKMVSLTERVIHLEKQSENMAKKDVVDRHDRDIRSMQTSLIQVRAQVVQLERSNLNEGRSGVGESTSAQDLQRYRDRNDSQFAQIDVQMAELDLRFQILETPSYDGTLMWKLRDYNRRKQDAAVQGRTPLDSQPFYTHRYGYKMCARVYLNGDGMERGSFLSLYLVVMRGEYDRNNPWPVRFTCTAKLLALDNHFSESIVKEITFECENPEAVVRIEQFVSHDEVESERFLRDDTIFIYIKIKTDLGVSIRN